MRPFGAAGTGNHPQILLRRHLPLSQDYGIGPIRLAVERPAAISGLPSPVWATVWQTERQAKGPWRSSASEILELADEVVGSFLADYRRAVGQ